MAMQKFVYRYFPTKRMLLNRMDVWVILMKIQRNGKKISVSLSFIPFSSCSTNGDKYISCLFSEEEFARHLLRQMIRDKIAMPEAALPETVPPKQEAWQAAGEQG